MCSVLLSVNFSVNRQRAKSEILRVILQFKLFQIADLAEQLETSGPVLKSNQHVTYARLLAGRISTNIY